LSNKTPRMPSFVPEPPPGGQGTMPFGCHAARCACPKSPV
jgi:hypothetical protein